MGLKMFKRLAVLRKPSHLRVFLSDLFRLKNKILPDKSHLLAAMEWLSRAQDITKCGGVSASYSLREGWAPPYPETTGYIIPTFLRYSLLTGNSSYLDRAIRMGDWEIEIQLSSGAIRGGIGIQEYPIVFDTGQVILGWNQLFRETNLTRFLDAAVKAADWLLGVQDNDGKWVRHTHKGLPWTYQARVAWPLLELYGLTREERYKISAEKNILWALSYAKENGWIELMSFDLDESPFTHTIGYTLEGLLESSFYLAEEIKQKILSAVQKACKNIIMKYKLGQKSYFAKTYLPATLDEEWNPASNYSCLVGNAQIAVIMLRLYNINNDEGFLNAAIELIDGLKVRQSLDCKNTGIRGAIPGSFPIWGRYAPLSYPNWAAKFFSDALLLKNQLT